MINKKMNRKSDEYYHGYYDDKLVREVAKIIYERLRERLEREGITNGLPHYEELFKKYNGEKERRQYFDELLQLDQNEKDNKKNRQD